MVTPDAAAVVERDRAVTADLTASACGDLCIWSMTMMTQYFSPYLRLLLLHMLHYIVRRPQCM